MNNQFDNLMYAAGLTAQGCWDTMDDYDRAAILKFAELVVKECMACSTWVGRVNKYAIEPVHTAHTINQRIKEHFGVEE